MKVRFINSMTHGFADYAGAFILLTTPVIANFGATSELAFWISVGAGITLLVYSLFTDYALSIRKVIPLKVHLMLDALASTAFLLIPFLFGIEGLARLFFVANGLLVWSAVLLTDSRSDQPSTSLN